MTCNILRNQVVRNQNSSVTLVGCPRLHIQYFRNYPPYLKAVSYIRNLRTRLAVVTRDPAGHVYEIYTKFQPQNLKARDHLVDLVIDGNRILTSVLN
jgi:hypothetical protein